ncbi:extensin family protein [Paracoccus sp. M683]|uniref:extensin-like domain-containing protein n=1 Tax=Paracoccus sp. M683 TaxID=2594268 RepID=UPI00117DFE30|nr:extensin family protein [Paracoccus sp. M683]TRW99457.1 extensin family protein [Paracoccus sp. M683]
MNILPAIAAAATALALTATAVSAQDRIVDQVTRPPQKPEQTAPNQTVPAPIPAPDRPRNVTAEELPAKDRDPAPSAEPVTRPLLRESDLSYAACRVTLILLGTEYEELPPLTDADRGDCGIARPIRVTQILPGVALEGGATMRCDTARALGFWLKDFVQPAASRLPGSPRLSGLQLGTTYDCRARVGTGEAPKLSEHALGNAIDIAGLAFDGGETIPVQPRQDSGDLVEAFQRAIRGAACLHFTTVLGPGSNAAHDDHLHLDLAARNGGWRLCQ